MSDPRYLEIVERALTRSRDVRSRQIEAFDNDVEAWRRALVRLASGDPAAVPAYQSSQDFFDRTILSPFAIAWQEADPMPGRWGMEQWDLRDAVLSGQTFGGCTYGRSPLEGADFRGAKLDETEWIGMQINRADFTGASLRGSRLLKADIGGASFRAADLRGSLFVRPTCAGNPADFSGANLSGAQFILSSGTSLKLTGANLSGASVSYPEPRHPADKLAFDRVVDEFVASADASQRGGINVVRREVVKSSRACFIATAACGDEEAEEVVALRMFREQRLRASALGNRLIRLYEWLSPPLARLLSRSERARWAVRVLLVRPLALTARALVR